MQGILGPGVANPIATVIRNISQQKVSQPITVPGTSISPTQETVQVTSTGSSSSIQSNIITQKAKILLERLIKGGTFVWQKMTLNDRNILINTYGYGSKELFLKYYKQTTGKYLDIRDEATPAQRLSRSQIKGFMKGGSVLTGIPLKSIFYKAYKTKKYKPTNIRKGKHKYRSQKRMDLK